MTGRCCSKCKTTGDLWKTFAACEWDKPDDDRKCLWCMTKTCSQCRRAKTKSLFSADQWQLPEESPARTCYDCDRKQCSKCGEPKTKKEFIRHAWQLEAKDPNRVCLACTRGRREVGKWTCRNKRCNLQKPIADFSICRAKYGEAVKGNSRQCNACVERFEAECAEMARASAAMARSTAPFLQKRQRIE